VALNCYTKIKAFAETCEHTVLLYNKNAAAAFSIAIAIIKMRQRPTTAAAIMKSGSGTPLLYYNNCV
jgi:hypothetical protein